MRHGGRLAPVAENPPRQSLLGQLDRDRATWPCPRMPCPVDEAQSPAARLVAAPVPQCNLRAARTA